MHTTTESNVQDPTITLLIKSLADHNIVNLQNVLAKAQIGVIFTMVNFENDEEGETNIGSFIGPEILALYDVSTGDVLFDQPHETQITDVLAFFQDWAVPNNFQIEPLDLKMLSNTIERIATNDQDNLLWKMPNQGVINESIDQRNYKKLVANLKAECLVIGIGHLHTRPTPTVLLWASNFEAVDITNFDSNRTLLLLNEWFTEVAIFKERDMAMSLIKAGVAREIDIIRPDLASENFDPDALLEDFNLEDTLGVQLMLHPINALRRFAETHSEFAEFDEDTQSVIFSSDQITNKISFSVGLVQDPDNEDRFMFDATATFLSAKEDEDEASFCSSPSDSIEGALSELGDIIGPMVNS